MSNSNYVCFRCRTSIRHPKISRKAPKCLACGEECFCLGSKVAIPKHDDEKAWKKLRDESWRRARASAGAASLRRVRRQHFLEQEIIRLKALPTNRDRNRRIGKLEKELLVMTGKPEQAG